MGEVVDAIRLVNERKTAAGMEPDGVTMLAGPEAANMRYALLGPLGVDYDELDQAQTAVTTQSMVRTIQHGLSAASVMAGLWLEGITVGYEIRDARARRDPLADLAENVVACALPVLALEGSALTGYRLSNQVDPVVCATIEEWVDLATAVAALHRRVARLDEDGQHGA